MRTALLALVLSLTGTITPATAAQPPVLPKTVRVFALKNADAEKLRGIVLTIFGRQGVVASVDARTNTLVVSADADTLEEVRKLVEELDKPAKPKK